MKKTASRATTTTEGRNEAAKAEMNGRRAPMLEGMLRGLAATMGPLDVRPFVNFHHFVLAHGRPFVTMLFPERFLKHIAFPKLCFMNAFMLVSEFPGELAYAEGFATHQTACSFPVLHGWAVDRAGRVVDPTWRDGGFEYYGVEFDLGYATKILARGRKAGVASVIDNFKDGWPLLDGRHDDWMPKKAC